MTINTKRLETDAAYWDEVAPEGATHYDVADGEPNAWMKKDGDYWYAWVSSGNWSKYAADIHEAQSDFIPRPAKPAAPEWDGSECPPTGWHGECTWGSKEEWIECVILTDGKIAKNYRGGYWEVDSVSNLPETEFREIRTKEQRQREELIEVINKSDEMAYSFRPDDIADAILSRYNLEPKK